MDSFKKMPINWAFKCLKMKPSIVSKRNEIKTNVCFHKKTVPKNKKVKIFPRVYAPLLGGAIHFIN